MNMESQDRVDAFKKRTEQFLKLGHDRFAAAKFVAECAGPLESPALDVGTGRGLLAAALAARSLQVTSVDNSDENLLVAQWLAREKGLSDRIEFMMEDASSLPFANQFFKTAAMMDVLHHLEDAGQILSEMARVLRPGGKLIVAEFDEEGFEMVAKMHTLDGLAHSRSGSTIESAARFLGSIGLQEEGRAEAHQNVAVWFIKPL
jgi:ubiquinone/menaquinone biosynthesis C-methylase UbiE